MQKRGGQSFVARLKNQGRVWLDFLMAARNVSLHPGIVAVLLGIGVVVVFALLIFMPILGLGVAAAAGLYVYLTRDQYLPVRSYNWKKDYDPVRPEAERAERAGYRRRKPLQRGRGPLKTQDVFSRLSTVILVGVGGPITAVAQGPVMGMIVTFTLAIAILALADPESFRLNVRRTRRG